MAEFGRPAAATPDHIADEPRPVDVRTAAATALKPNADRASDIAAKTTFGVTNVTGNAGSIRSQAHVFYRRDQSLHHATVGRPIIEDTATAGPPHRATCYGTAPLRHPHPSRRTGAA